MRENSAKDLTVYMHRSFGKTSDARNSRSDCKRELPARNLIIFTDS
jgi:hypothetical protein